MFGNLGYETYEAVRNNAGVLGDIVKNISNIKSIGYKKAETSFVKALNSEVLKYANAVHSQGPLRKTGEPFDAALDGPGYFEVEMTTGERAYTRAGRFRLSDEGELVTEEGYKVIPKVENLSKEVFEVNDGGKDKLSLDLKVSTPKLIIPTSLVPEILEDGTVNGIDPESGEQLKIGKISLVTFNNPQGLKNIGGSYFSQTKESGQAKEIEPGMNAATRVQQGFLEFANVNLVTEMANLNQLKTIMTAQVKTLKVIDKIYENVHYTISRNA